MDPKSVNSRHLPGGVLSRSEQPAWRQKDGGSDPGPSCNRLTPLTSQLLSPAATGLSVCLQGTVFIPCNSQPGWHPARRSNSVAGLWGPLHAQPRSPVPPLQLDPAHAATSPRSGSKPSQAPGRKQWSRFSSTPLLPPDRSPLRPPPWSCPSPPRCPSGRA